MSFRYFVSACLLFLTFGVLSPLSLWAQGYANHWYFGIYSGINFSSGAPVYDPNNTLNINEGTVTMSDEQGNLLFYYGGDSVVNANHQQMANGQKIGGVTNGTVTQFFATQQPDSNHLYYVFTPANPVPNGFELLYSVIDMSKQGGLGEVVIKDSLLIGSLVTEMVHGVKHANGKDIWITAIKEQTVAPFTEDTLCTFLLSATGIGPISKFVPGYDLQYRAAQIKFAATGDHFACTQFESTLTANGTVLLQFDNATGLFSNPIFIDSGPKSRGIEFSCDGTKLYVMTGGDLKQYDVSVHDSATVAGSIAIQPLAAFLSGWLQLGPDHRIYGRLEAGNRLFAINQPHLSGTQSDFVDSVAAFPSLFGQDSYSTFEPTCLCVPRILYEDSCQTDTTFFTLTYNGITDSVLWDFGDPASATLNADTGFAPYHIYQQPGTYLVQAIYHQNGVVDTVTETVTIIPVPQAILGPDTSVCPGDSVLLDASQPQVTYLWSDGSTDSTLIAYPIDTVSVTWSNVCGAVSDTIIIDTNVVLTVDLGPDTVLCLNDSLLLSISADNLNVLWSQGSTTDSIWVQQPGSYSVTVSNSCAAASDTIIIDTLHFPVVQLGNDTVLCEGDTIELLTDTAQLDYVWQDGTTGPHYEVMQPDTYILSASNACGVAMDTIVIDSLIAALVIFPDDSVVCLGDTVVLDASIEQGSYLWQDNSTDSLFVVTQTGTYWAEGTNLCGISSDTIVLTFVDVPVVDLGPDTILCEGDSLLLDAFSPFSTYNWSNGSSDSAQWIQQGGGYAVTVENVCASVTDSIDLKKIAVLGEPLGPDTFLCEGYSMSLFASMYQATYLWHNGSTDSTILFSQGGQKWVEATNVCGTFSDTVFIQDILFPMVALPGDTALCENDSLLLNATFVGAWYLWNNSSTDSVLLVQDSGFYSVQVTNECGTVTDSINMTLEDSLLFDLGADTVLCTGDSLLLNTFLSNDYPHFWQDTAGLNSFLVLVSGNYWVFVQNACGEAADTVVVAFTEQPTIDLGSPQLLCSGDSVALDASFPFSTYSWNTTDTTDVLWVFNSGTYAVTTTNICGFDADSVQVDFDDTLEVELGPAVWGCVGTVETLSAQVSGAGEYQWSTGLVTEQIQVDAEADYWLDVTNVCGTIRDSVRVNFREVPQVTVSADTQICTGDEIVLTGISNNDTLEWNNGLQGGAITVSTQGLYWLQSTNYCGTARDSVRVGVQPRPEIVLPANLQICPGEKRLLQPFPRNLDYFWQDGSNRADFLVEAEGEYQVIGYSELGCVDTASVLVRICPSLWVPSAFTPDGDGLNDVFKVEGESLDEFELLVFSRWGELVYRTENFQQGWNGWYKGFQAPQGVYSWKVFFINREGKEEVRAGSVTLIR